MSRQFRHRMMTGARILMVALALSGCGHKDDTASGFPSQGTPAQVQQAVQQQATQRAAYYGSHPGPAGQSAAANPYIGHP